MLDKTFLQISSASGVVSFRVNDADHYINIIIVIPQDDGLMDFWISGLLVLG